MFVSHLWSLSNIDTDVTEGDKKEWKCFFEIPVAFIKNVELALECWDVSTNQYFSVDQEALPAKYGTVLGAVVEWMFACSQRKIFINSI